MAAEVAKKPGRKKLDGAAPARERRFYIMLSPEGLRLLREMAEPRGGFASAKAAVLEEAIRRMHSVDDMIKRRKPAKEAAG
jgi:hypothetical protein